MKEAAFSLTLFPDSLPEGPESFQISSVPTGNAYLFNVLQQEELQH